MAIRVDILTPINTTGQNGGTVGTVYSAINSGAVYSVAGYSSIVVQIDCVLDAAIAGTVTLQASLDAVTWHNFPSGAITYTAVGIQAAVNVEGLRYVRVQYTTLSGTVEVMLTVSGVANV
jgi:hypothetical protein